VNAQGGALELPSVIPLFPLPNAVLFPGVPLPLHIFEPRYREMVRDAMAGEARLIGMVLLRGDWREDYLGRPEIFAIGCAGRMVNVEPLADGRYNILLQGVREFVVQREIGDTSYRQAEVDWHRPPAGGGLGGLRDELRGVMRRFLASNEPKLAARLLDDASISDELLVNSLCHVLDFPPLERQALLEAQPLSARAQRLCDVLRFALEAAGGEGSRWRH